MENQILVLNVGSSSIRFAVFDATEPPTAARLRGKIAGIGVEPRLDAVEVSGRALPGLRWNDPCLDHEALLVELLGWLSRHTSGDTLRAAGHRVVHGGTEFVEPVLLDTSVLDRLEALAPLAPLHQPHTLSAIRAVTRLRPDVPQIACFDTAFHAAQPTVATRLAIPRALGEAGLRRYGFHGLSYEFVSARLREIDPCGANGRVIIAHLGSGASLCAVRAGMSVETTMGFSPLDGLVMGTRCGTLDPGVLLYLMRENGWRPWRLEQLLYEESGLLGVSGLSADMHVLLESEDPRAGEAIELFNHRLAREAAALVATLGGLDTLVFTAGIGENAPAIRREACHRLAWLGIAIDDEANEGAAPLISTADSRVSVRIIPTDEELVIARAANRLLACKEETSDDTVTA